MRYALAIIFFALPMFGQTTETIVVACSGPCSLASEPTSPWDLPSCHEYSMDDALIESMNHGDRSAVELLRQRHAITFTYSERHRIAAALLHHVADDSALWNEIFEPAENLVRFSLADDRISPEFAQWCAEHDFAPADYKQMAFDAFWAALSDSRSHALMIRALDNPDWNVVASAIYGLGVQKDEASRPLIEKAIERFPDQKVTSRQFIKEGFGDEETSR